MEARPLQPDDCAAVVALVKRHFSGTRYVARLIEQAGESRGLGVFTPDGATLAAALFDDVGGANGVVKLHALIGHDGMALRLAFRAFTESTHAARLVVCELPDDEVFAHIGALLLEGGFAEESRADAVVADGVALRFLVSRPGRS